METKTITLILTTLLLIATAAAQNNTLAQGGNTTPLTISLNTHTNRWNGLVGNIQIVNPFSPDNITAEGGNINFSLINITTPCPNPTSITGFILFSNSTTPPASLSPGNLTLLDQFIAAPITNESATNTFTNTTTFTIQATTITNVPTTHTHVNNQSQQSVFREGYFNDGSNNIIFAVEINLNTQGYNTSIFDYQAILPVQNTTDVIYYITTDLTITCPTGSTKGGSSSAHTCITNWICGNWTTCNKGFQNRTCTKTFNCPHVLVYPSLTRRCPDKPRAAATTTQEIITDLKQRQIHLTLPPEITVISGHPTQIPITIKNPDDLSLEQLHIEIDIPTTPQPITPLHTNPLLHIFGLTPLKHTNTIPTWTQNNTLFRLNPRETLTIPHTLHAPLITPRTIQAQVNLYSGNFPITTKPIKIKVETYPFTAMTETQGKTTSVKFLIDNRGKKTHQATVELNINNKKSTIAPELYSITVPPDTVSIYGYQYTLPKPYTTITARYLHHTTEATHVHLWD